MCLNVVLKYGHNTDILSSSHIIHEIQCFSKKLEEKFKSDVVFIQLAQLFFNCLVVSFSSLFLSFLTVFHYDCYGRLSVFFEEVGLTCR